MGVATAGQINHGKTALAPALTGIDTVRRNAQVPLLLITLKNRSQLPIITLKNRIAYPKRRQIAIYCASRRFASISMVNKFAD
jgi:translation initiation factor 2 gamma subunit (eIF-2gamma)